MLLAEEDEDYLDVKNLPPEQLLLRWVNYHLKNAEQNMIRNLGLDLKNSMALIYLLNQLDSEKCSLDALTEPDELKRA